MSHIEGQQTMVGLARLGATYTNDCTDVRSYKTQNEPSRQWNKAPGSFFIRTRSVIGYLKMFLLS